MAKNLSVKDIVEITNGKLIIGNDQFICKNFLIDTRKLKKDDVFVAIKGDGVDGNSFWKNAFESGAKVVILDNTEFLDKDLSDYKEKIIIKVEDTIEAMQKLAIKKRELYKEIPVIAITGSVGKTSTKDTIASVLSQKYKVLKTQGNYNNGLGVPLTILSLQDEELAVVEMGMNHFGEIELLSKIAKPNIAVITNIGTSHIGNLGSRENILKAKLEILDGMEQPVVVVNNDNDLLHDWAKKNANKFKIRTFGVENKSEAMAKNINSKENYSEFTCNLEGDEFNIKVPVPGNHFVLNALCSALLGRMMNLTNQEIAQGIGKLELTKKRMEVTVLKNEIKIINDSYNASYESMKAAIEYLSAMENGRKIAVLGDMFELGEYAEELHKKVGEEVAKNNIDILLCCGENAKYIAKEAEEKGMPKEKIYYKENLKELEQTLKKLLKPQDNVLIKASNGMQFFKLAERIIGGQF